MASATLLTDCAFQLDPAASTPVGFREAWGRAQPKMQLHIATLEDSLQPQPPQPTTEEHH